MKESVILEFEGNISIYHEFLFKINRLPERLFISETEIDKINFTVINIPIYKKHIINEKKLIPFIKKFICYLEKNGVKNVILSDKAVKIKNLDNKLSEKFVIFNGKNIIRNKFSDIIRKHAYYNEKKPDGIAFYANNFSEFYELFSHIFNEYKNFAVVTEERGKFDTFSSDIFNDYGFMVKVYDLVKFKKNRDYLSINVDMELNGIKCDIDLKNLSMIFSRNEKIKNLYKHFKRVDQRVIEFLINELYGEVNKSTINEFFNDYKIRIVKINKK